jgi:hypothetical protein
MFMDENIGKAKCSIELTPQANWGAGMLRPYMTLRA